MDISLLLGVVGLFVTIFFAEPVYKKSIDLYWYLKNKRKWDPDIQVDQEVIPRHRYYAFENWSEKVTVNLNGDAVKVIDSKIVNVSDKLLTDMTFPIYGDGSVSAKDLKLWGKQNNKSLRIKIEEWNRDKSRGRARLYFDPPIPPGKRCRYRWGHSFPGVYSPGDEWYSYDVATRHNVIKGELEFDKSWKILYAHWKDDLGSKQPQVSFSENKINWCVWFPDEGSRIIVKFGLQKI